MKKIVFIAKTNLNNDGRILNELRILKNRFDSAISIDFILMPDKPLDIEVKEVDQFYSIKTSIRNNSFFRFITVIEFTLKALILLIRIKPDIIHAQDTAITLPVYLYKTFYRKSIIIYDDHEVPNEKESIQVKIFHFFENLLMKKADIIIAANHERILYLNKYLDKSEYLLNLPYFEDSSKNKEFTIAKTINLSKKKRMNNLKFFMHQGIIEIERGRQKLAEFSGLLPNEYKILIVGVSKEYFDAFILEYSLSEESFVFIGSVPYFELAEYWRLADASLVMYLPNYVNNRLCAPNRLYISFLNALPIIVNKDNPVLSNFVKDNSCGLFIEDLNGDNLEKIWDVNYTSEKMESLKEAEKQKLIAIYRTI